MPLFHATFPEAQIGISTRDQKLLAGDFSLLPTEAQHKIKGGFSKQAIHVDFTFESDHYQNFEIVSTPGHTPGSVTFFDATSGIMIAGDAFQTRGGVTVAGVRKLLFPFPSFGTWDPQTAFESAKRLANKQPTVLAIGHGDFLMNPIPQLQQAIAVAGTRLSTQT